MGVFTRVFRRGDSAYSSRAQSRTAREGPTPAPAQPVTYQDAWTRKEVRPEEVQQLLRLCTQEMKSRALDMPFLLLPFRPYSDPNAAKTFIRNFFNSSVVPSYSGSALVQELRITEPTVLCSILKWCWSRLSGGVVGWNTYELFCQGERESNLAKNAFDTFIPLSVDSEARTRIISDFFELLAAIAAHGKTNGLSGGKLSRLAGWWAFDHSDADKSFDGGYRSWSSAAAATSHLFFAYLRSLAPDSVVGGTVSKLPRSLQTLLTQTSYPPVMPTGLFTPTSKVVMVVSTVSPTPFALLRRAKDFDYRDDDRALQTFSDYHDPVSALTPECRRVLEAISSTNSSSSRAIPTERPGSPTDAAWSKFQDMGFSSLLDGTSDMDGDAPNAVHSKASNTDSVRNSRIRAIGRPATPSWADFTSIGFSDDSSTQSPPSYLTPPDKLLPPLSPSRVQSSQANVKGIRDASDEPGELAGVTRTDMDETFWWVWMTSLAHEEPDARKAVFGRCAIVETNISGGRWLVVEEQVKGAASALSQQALIVQPKKNKFATLTMRNRDRRASSTVSSRPPVAPVAPGPQDPYGSRPQQSRTTLAPDQQARVKAAAAALVQQRIDEEEEEQATIRRRGRTDESDDAKTVSVMSLGMQPLLSKDAAPAFQWARKFDREELRKQYLGDNEAGRGLATGHSPSASTLNLETALSAGDATDRARGYDPADRELPAAPSQGTAPGSFEPSSPPRVPQKDFPAAPTAELPPPAGSSMDAVKQILQQSGASNEPTTPVQQNTARFSAGESTLVNKSPGRRLQRKPIGSVDSTTRNGPAYSSVQPPTEQQSPSTPQKQAATVAAAAAAQRTSPQSIKSINQTSPNKRMTRQARSRNFRSMFNKRKAQTPESLAAQKAMSGPTTNNTSSLPVERPSRTSSFLRRTRSPQSHPPMPTTQAAPPEIGAPRRPPPQEVAMGGISASDEAAMIRARRYRNAEPEPEIARVPSYPEPRDESFDVPRPAFAQNPNNSTSQFSNFTQGPMEETPRVSIAEERPLQRASFTPVSTPPMPQGSFMTAAPVQAPPKAPMEYPPTPPMEQSRMSPVDTRRRSPEEPRRRSPMEQTPRSPLEQTPRSPAEPMTRKPIQPRSRAQAELPTRTSSRDPDMPAPGTFKTRAAAFLAPERMAPLPPSQHFQPPPQQSQSPSQQFQSTPQQFQLPSQPNTPVEPPSEFRTPMETLEDPMDEELTPTASRGAAASPSAENVTALPSEPAFVPPPRSTSTPQPETPTESAADRWAQIRRNAAERRTGNDPARREMPQQKPRTPSVRTKQTDESGEASGEETIESRVARIKARVAELTASNQGQQGATSGHQGVSFGSQGIPNRL